MIIIDTKIQPRKIRLYCIKNRYGKPDCNVNNLMRNRLNSLRADIEHSANVIHMSEDGKHLLLDFSIKEFNPEDKPVDEI